jgi:hypothetical protein
VSLWLFTHVSGQSIGPIIKVQLKYVTGCPERSVNNYKLTMCNIPERRRLQKQASPEYKRFAATPKCVGHRNVFEKTYAYSTLRIGPRWTDVQFEESCQTCELIKRFDVQSVRRAKHTDEVKYKREEEATGLFGDSHFW